MLGAGVDRDGSTHILVSATGLVVVGLVLTRVGIAGVHVFVGVAARGRWGAVVVLGRVVGGVVWWVWGVGKVPVNGGCWRGREVVGRGKVLGVVVRASSRFPWTVST